MEEIVLRTDKEVKEKLVEGIVAHNKYNGQYLIDKVNTTDLNIHKVPTNKTIPTHVKKGDVFYSLAGSKVRPCVVVKVLKDEVIFITLTSSDNSSALIPSKSRFFGEGYFGKTLSNAPIELVLNRFLGVYDNPKNLNLAIKEIKKYFIDNL